MTFLWAPPRYTNLVRTIGTLVVVALFCAQVLLFSWLGQFSWSRFIPVFDIILFVLLLDFHLPVTVARIFSNGRVIVPGPIPANKWMQTGPSRWGRLPNHDRFEYYFLFSKNEIKSVQQIDRSQLEALSELDSIDTEYAVAGKQCILIRFKVPLPQGSPNGKVFKDDEDSVRGVCIRVNNPQKAIALLRRP